MNAVVQNRHYSTKLRQITTKGYYHFDIWLLNRFWKYNFPLELEVRAWLNGLDLQITEIQRKDRSTRRLLYYPCSRILAVVCQL